MNRHFLPRLAKLSAAQVFTAFFSSAFQAFGMYHIHAVSRITEGGVLGLTLFLNHWLGISPALSGAVLNAACYLLGWRLLGREFIACSLIAAAGFSVGYGICELFPPLWPGIAAYPLAAAVLGSMFIGIGAGLCVRAGGATSGDDALAMSLAHVTRFEIQWIYLASDLTVIVLSLTYIPPARLVYSLITVVLSGQIIGWIQKIPAKKLRT